MTRGRRSSSRIEPLVSVNTNGGRSREAIPVLPAFRTAAGGLRVWCRWCVRWHYHGTLGHAVAHCIEDASPYHRAGYVLAVGRQDGDGQELIAGVESVQGAVRAKVSADLYE